MNDFGSLRRLHLHCGNRQRKPKPPAVQQSVRARMQRMALVRHAMTGEDTRKKAPVTLPKLKFMEQD